MTISDNMKTALYVIGGLLALAVIAQLMKRRTRAAVTVGTGASAVPEDVAGVVARAVGPTPVAVGSSAPPANGI